ncbi:right-handed parallel beta-helix repeat-containing protein [Phragmitibacter flavus]|uniref:Right-handed parallel beta-helix repeat-containing protein n=1 Tax=Phragmitibacter flavus TaxID=2576071 RepID=A0A5R8KG22_9BACT|nr:right-handed parallel beta-helix repeat-containing protein [Phragmitibacter flavus]TLD71257.1 right-handed parallel beta-helix repeat-containing protein [Phragmitibacter flavus]
MPFRLLLAFLLLPTLLPALELHVAPTGNDSAPGTREAPLATLTVARDKIRQHRKDTPLTKPITVWLHHGTYETSTTLTLEAQDSGTAEFPITYRAVENASPIFIGAPKVDFKTFTPHQGEILKADVSALGLKDITIRQLLHNGQRQTLARYPNRDAADPLYRGWAFIPELPDPLPENHQWKLETYLAPADIRQWAHPEDVEIDIYAQYGWWNWVMSVKSLDSKTRKLTLAKPCGYDLHPHNRYYFQNALEELDAPGEWFLDKRTQTLYYWPEKPLGHGDEIRIPKLTHFVKIASGTQHITLRGLHLTGSNGTAIVVENAQNITIAGNNIHHSGNFTGGGISLHGGKNNLATGNHLSHLGASGISLGGGDRITLSPANNIADNNHIHHIGIFNKNAPGISLYGVGNKVTHNLIHHTPRMAVQFSGNNLTIDYNHLHHTVQETQDGGAVYTGGRDWISSRGTSLRYNLIHDTIGVGQGKDGLHWPHFTWGIYMDDNAAGLDIIGNIVARSARASLHLHNGRDHLIENNLFVDGGERQIEFNGWNKDHRFFDNHYKTMLAGWDSIKDRPEWKSMRNIELDPRNALREDGTIMSGNIFRRNIIAWNEPTLRYLDLRHCTPKHNTVESNLVWNSGHTILTGVNKTGPDIGPDILNTQQLLTDTPPGKTPKGWGWNHKPLPELQITATDGIITVPAATGPDPKNAKSVIHLPTQPFKPGTSYRARLKVRSTEPTTTIGFHYGSYASPGGYWSTGEQKFTATPEWQDIEISGNLPAENTPAYKSWMKTFWLRLDIHAEKGQIQMKDITLKQAAPASNWEAWQSEGWDKNSHVADPRLVSKDSDDFRLNPDSPAPKLINFEPVPIEKIGLYPSEFRAN